MIALFLIPIYIAANIYIYAKFLKWTRACHGFCHTKTFRTLSMTVYGILALSPALAFLFDEGTKIQRILQVMSNFWVGVFLYIAMALAVCLLVGFLLRRFNIVDRETQNSRKYIATTGAVIMIFVVTVSSWGLYNSKNIHVTDYDVEIDKSVAGMDDMRIVLVADCHLGYNMGIGKVRDMVDEINDLEPDLVCFAGDIFNNDFDAIDHPKKTAEALRSIDSTYGTYACYGNHDVSETIIVGFTFNWGNTGDDRPVSDPRMDRLLEDGDVTLLQDQVVNIDDKFYLGGRLDAANPGRVSGVRKTESQMTDGLDMSKPVIMMDHQPTSEALHGLSAAGVDLDLSGHTHGGQFFPMNISAKIMWENAAGMIKIGDMTSVVTSGVGVYGPDMRVCSKSEICCIDVTFS